MNAVTRFKLDCGVGKVKHAAASVLRGAWLCRILRRRFKRLRRATVTLQAHWRGVRARVMFAHQLRQLLSATISRSLETLVRTAPPAV